MQSAWHMAKPPFSLYPVPDYGQHDASPGEMAELPLEKLTPPPLLPKRSTGIGNWTSPTETNTGTDFVNFYVAKHIMFVLCT